MSRLSAIMRRGLSHFSTSSQTAIHRPAAAIEILEDRRLLSAALLTTSTTAVTSVPPITVSPVVPANSSGGVTIHETAGLKFTALLGTFITIAPATGLTATISWGDGGSSAGTIKPVSIIGIDEIKFSVLGSHKYVDAGKYGIKIVVSKPGLAGSTPFVVATIDSTAVVAKRIVSLDGTIAGRYIPAPTAADIGATYVFNGTGTAGVLGAVSAHATLTIPGFVVTGHATGTLTLTSVSTSAAKAGSITLKLTGPTEAGMGPIPTTLSYVVTGGTGAYANDTSTGTISVTLDTATQSFAFVIHSVLPPTA